MSIQAINTSSRLPVFKKVCTLYSKKVFNQWDSLQKVKKRVSDET